MSSLVVNLIVGITTPIVAGALVHVLRKAGAFLHIKASAEQEAQIDKLAQDAATYAEEWAAAKLKVTGTKPTMDEKMSAATDHLAESMPGLSNKTAIDLIKRTLPQIGFGATGGRPGTLGALGAILLVLMLATSAHAQDAIANVQFTDAGATFPITTTITRAVIGLDGVDVQFDKRDGPNRWPDTQDFSPSGGMGSLEYSVGLVIQVNGQWLAASPIEFWNGRAPQGTGQIQDQTVTCPSGTGQIHCNWFYDRSRWPGLFDAHPLPGDTLGLYVVAGDVRNNVFAVRERSNIVTFGLPPSGVARTFDYAPTPPPVVVPPPVEPPVSVVPPPAPEPPPVVVQPAPAPEPPPIVDPPAPQPVPTAPPPSGKVSLWQLIASALLGTFLVLLKAGAFQ